MRIRGLAETLSEVLFSGKPFPRTNFVTSGASPGREGQTVLHVLWLINRQHNSLGILKYRLCCFSWIPVRTQTRSETCRVSVA